MAAAAYLDEEEVWKCPKHPSRRHRCGVCPVCLRDRLSSLCPDCANERPCACSALTTSSSSSSSSSFSRFSISGGECFGTPGAGSVGRVSSLIESEPAFRRSRSVSVPFLQSKPKFVGKSDFAGIEDENEKRQKTTSFWSFLKGWQNRDHKSKKSNDMAQEEGRRIMMMRKSRSVAARTSDYGKSRGGKWYFPSPIKAFRQSRLSKVVVQERSPMYRG